MKKLLILLSVLIIIPLAVVPFISGCAPTAETEEPVRIGALVSLTGDIAFWGPDSNAGVAIALDEWDHEVAGRPIEYYYEDDGSTDAVMALDHAKKLVEVDKVDVILQPSCSGPFLGMRDYCNGLGVLTIGQGWRGEFLPYSMSQEEIGIPASQRYDICNTGSAAQIDYAVGKYVYEELGMRTAATLSHDYETGYQTTGGFVHGFMDAGGTIVQQQWAPFGTVDFGPYLAALKDADMTFSWFTGPMMPLIAKQYYEFGLWNKQPLMCGLNDSFYEPDLAELGDWTTGMYVVTEFPSGYGTTAMHNYVSTFKENTGRYPNPCTGFGAYVATNIYLETVDALDGNTDDTAVRDKIIGSTYKTLKGNMTFDPEGYPICGAFVTQVDKMDMFGETDVLTFRVIKEFSNLTHPGYYTKP